VKVQAPIQELTDRRMKGLDLSADKVLEELARLGFSNMLDYVTIQKRRRGRRPLKSHKRTGRSHPRNHG